MLNVDVMPIIGKNNSRYSLVIAVSRHARDLVRDADSEHISLIGKPVSLSLNDFLDESYAFLEPEEIRKI